MSHKLLNMKKVPTSMFITLCLVMVILISITDRSLAQSTNQRLTAIEKQLNALQRQVFTPGSRFQSGADNNSSNEQNAPTTATGAGGGLIADVNIRISELETQIRQMTGQLEEANFKVDTLTRKLETLEKDYEFRLADLEKGGGGAPSNNIGGNNLGVSGSVTAPSPAITTPAVATGSTPKQQYDYAYSLVSKGQYAEAEISLMQFLEAHPDDELAGNAQYWLGQTYYARGNYTDATRTFLEGMSKYPESSKAPAFLLKVGMSLTNLGETSEACEVYRELDSRFPQSTENTRMRPAEERKAGCG